MKRVNECVVCGSKKILKYPGSLAPFISQYVFEGRETKANLSLCPVCQMLFSDARFDDDEMRKLYSDYRGERYKQVREKFEPGYGKINDSFNGAKLEVINRGLFSKSVLAAHHGKIEKVFDFGGDRGQYIPDNLSKSKRYVYDVSGVKPLEGIGSVAKPEDAAPYDLVMCCHVLEHVSFPVDTLLGLKKLIAKGGVLYVEVPAGIPTRRYFEASLARHQIGKKKTPVFHEHINYFTKCSLRNALLIAGFRPLETRIGLIEFGWTQAPVIGCVAEVGPTQEKARYGRFHLMLEGIEYGVRRNLLPPLGNKADLDL